LTSSGSSAAKDVQQKSAAFVTNGISARGPSGKIPAPIDSVEFQRGRFVEIRVGGIIGCDVHTHKTRYFGPTISGKVKQ
jgi:hypothetical protein